MLVRIETKLFLPFLENEATYDPDLYEGDMVLTTDQRLAATLGLDIDAPYGRGSTVNRQWPRGVMAYVIDSSLSMFLKRKISSYKYYLARNVGNQVITA